LKILYGVQGTGNGHIARSRAMAQAFTKAGMDVDFLFSGRDPNRYFSMEAFGSYQTRQGLTFQSHHGKIDPLQTMVQAKPRHFLREIRELDVSGYDVVINDFEPVSAWAAHRQQVPCIGISHQNSFCYPTQALQCGWLDRQIVRYFAPCDVKVGLHWHHFNQPLLPPVVDIQSPLVVDQNIRAVHQSRSILVYLPFEDLAQIIALLQQLTNQQFICYHPQQLQAELQANVLLKPLSYQSFMQDLFGCQAVMSNAGFELPSEALTLGKKLLVKPLAGQFEQQNNAATLARLGLATRLQALDIGEIRRWLTTSPALPVQFPDVATALVAWVNAGHWQQPGSLLQLSQQLWSQVRYPGYATAEAASTG
jgi:uncharacterized protein (TIGR00661 family)